MAADANLMRRGLQVLADKKKSAEAVTVSIVRGPHTTTAVSAVLGSQLLKTTRADGNVKTERTDLDFFIQVADYKVNGAATEPERGDVIVYNGNRYKVLPYQDVAEKRDASGGFGIAWRIHTRRAGSD